MKRNNDKNPNIKGKTLTSDGEDDDLSSLTGSETSSASSSGDDQLFESNHTTVMDLHELQRDELPDNPLPEVKTRKLLKKKRPKSGQERPDNSAGSLTSSSEGSVVPPGPEKQEEFFDAHESYYDFPESQKSATIIAARTVTAKQVPEGNVDVRPATPNNLDPKRVPETPAITEATTVAATQDTATGQTPLMSANPIRSRTPK